MSSDNAASDFEFEHHQHPNPNEGDEAGTQHQHDRLPAHFHRDGMVFSAWPTVYPDPRPPEETAE
jgi:hypothetical protein